MKRNVVEWTVLVVSVAAIVVLVGALVLEGLRGGGPPDPAVTLHADRGDASAHGWTLPATVRNVGDEAAEEVAIEASAEVAGTTETSELVIDFLPVGTAVEAAFSFSGEPAGEVTVRVVSFTVP